MLQRPFIINEMLPLPTKAHYQSSHLAKVNPLSLESVEQVVATTVAIAILLFTHRLTATVPVVVSTTLALAPVKIAVVMAAPSFISPTAIHDPDHPKFAAAPLVGL